MYFYICPKRREESKTEREKRRNKLKLHIKIKEITFMILTWATPVTVSATPWAVSTISHIGLSVITSRESFWTSVTSHHAHAQPPTIVLFFVDPQQPPVGMKRMREKNIKIKFSINCFYVIQLVNAC